MKWRELLALVTFGTVVAASGEKHLRRPQDENTLDISGTEGGQSPELRQALHGMQTMSDMPPAIPESAFSDVLNSNVQVTEDRLLDAVGQVCRPINLIIVVDASETEGSLQNIKAAVKSILGDVTPVYIGVVVFGNDATAVVPFGPSSGVAANQAKIDTITPAMNGPGTQLSAPYSIIETGLKDSRITNNFPIVQIHLSDFMDTVASGPDTNVEAAKVDAFIKQTYTNGPTKNEHIKVGVAVPGKKDGPFSLPVAEGLFGASNVFEYPNPVDVETIGVKAIENKFCGVPPTLPPEGTKAPAPAATGSPTGSPTPPQTVPPGIPGTFGGLAAAGAFAWWFRSGMRKKYNFVPNPAFEEKVKEVMQASRSSQVGDDDATFALKQAKYEEDLAAYEAWLVTHQKRNDVEQVPSKAGGRNNRGLNKTLHSKYGVSIFTANFPAHAQEDDDQGVYQPMVKPMPPRRIPPRETEDQVKRRLANEPGMPPQFVLKASIEPEYKTGVFSPIYAALETWQEGVGPKVQEINPPETQPEARPQNKTVWSKVKAGLKGLFFGELTNDNVGKPVTKMIDNFPTVVRIPVRGVSVVGRYTFQFTYGVLFIPPWAIIRFFTPNIEFPLLTPKGRERDVTRQELAEAKAMNLTPEQRAELDKINADELPDPKAGYLILWEGLKSVFKGKGANVGAAAQARNSTGSARTPFSSNVTSPAPAPMISSQISSPNPIFEREERAATMTTPPPASRVPPPVPAGKPKPKLGGGRPPSE